MFNKRLFLFSLVFFNLTLSLFAAETIPLTLIGKDSRTGMQINPEFEVVSLKTGLKLPITKDGNYLIVKVLKGDRVQINAKADGYYPDEKKYEIDDEFTSEGRNIIFELDPQPSYNLIVELKDKVNGKLIEGVAEFSLDNEVVKKIIIDKKAGTTSAIFTKPGKYSVKVISSGYKEVTDELNIVVNDPPSKSSKTYELEKKQDILNFRIVKAGTDELISNVDLRIEDDKGNVLKNGLLSDGSAEINLKGNNKLSIKAKKEGFVSFSELIQADGGKLTIELKETAAILIDIKDSYYNKNIVSKVELTTPNGKVIELTSKEDQAITYIPTEKGRYLLKVSKNDYQSKSSDVNVTELNEKKYPIVVKISSIYEDFLLWVIDVNKKVIQGAEIRVIDDNQNDLPVELNKVTNEWIVKLNKNNNYSFSASAEGFDATKGQLDFSKGKLIPIVLKPKTNLIKVETIDKYTQTPVKSSIEFEDMPVELKGKVNELHEILLKQNQKIKPILTANGYQTYQAENIENQTLTTVLMVAETYPITFEIVDAITNEKIDPSFFNLINKKTSEPINVSLKSKLTVNLNAEESYYIVVKKEKYNDHSSPFLPSAIIKKGGTDNIKTISLSKKEFIQQTFKIISAETKLPLSTLMISVKSENGTDFKTTNDAQYWKSEIKSGVPFIVKIESEGYMPYEKRLDNLNNEEIVIELTKKVLDELTFEAFDEILNKNVPVKFSLLVNDKLIDLQNFDSGIRAKSSVEKNVNYTIRISAPDYKDKENSFIYTTETSNPLVLKFKKSVYPVKILITKPVNSQLLGTPSIEIVNAKGKAKTTYIFDKQSFMADLSPDGSYELTLSSSGFKTIKETVSLADFVANNLTKTYTLEAVEVPKKVEEMKPVIEEKPIVVEEKPVVVEKKPEPQIVKVAEPEKPKPAIEVEEVKAETVYTKNKRNLEDLPEKKESMVVALTNKDAIGKRYILTQVYFEQSSSKMSAASSEQLNSILSVLKENNALKVELVGHTDNVGDKRQNEYLSTFRAKVVSSFLFNNGIANDRITTKGMGDKFPLEPNDTEENKTKNRRVELIVIEN